jgi:hypothetical protein
VGWDVQIVIIFVKLGCWALKGGSLYRKNDGRVVGREEDVTSESLRLFPTKREALAKVHDLKKYYLTQV